MAKMGISMGYSQYLRLEQTPETKIRRVITREMLRRMRVKRYLDRLCTRFSSGKIEYGIFEESIRNLQKIGENKC